MISAQWRRVLVVDDDAPIRRLLSSVLKARGLIADEAADGAEAIALCAENPYRVILLDLLMPNVDGFAVLDALAKLPPSETPIVLVLTGADPETTQRLDSRRIHGVIRKPVEVEEVAALVRACIEIKAAGPFGPMAVAVIGSAQLIALLSSSRF